MRIAYLAHEGFMSSLCCIRPLKCFNFWKDICLEIVLFQRSYKPTDQIQALINLGQNVSCIKKVTMSLYMMVEIKDPQESNKILSKYTACQRIFESVHDFRTLNKKQEIQQRGIIMILDMQTMNQFYHEKKQQ